MVSRQELLRLLPFGFVLLWSSTFIGANVGLSYLSPLYFVAVRLTLCTVILVALMLVARHSWAALAQRRWLHCAVAGVALIVGLAAAESTTRATGLALAGLGVIGLVSGTVYFGRFCRGVALLPNVTAQFAAAALLAILSAATLEHTRADWTDAAILATAWNTLAVSLGGMALYYVLLKSGTAARAAANFYLVPGTTAVMAWLALGEGLRPVAILGFVVAAAGCWMVNARHTPDLALRRR